VRLAGATPVIVETKASDGYILQPDDLAAAITPKVANRNFTRQVHDLVSAT